MWQCEVLDVLYQNELDVTLHERPDDISDKDWQKLNRQACGAIRLFLARDQSDEGLRRQKDVLEDAYMKKSAENKLYLKKKLFRFQYTHGISMTQHWNTFNKLLSDLQNLDVSIDDEDKAFILLSSLPDTYDHLTTTLLNGKSTVKFDEVSNALMNNEVRRIDKQVHRDPTSSALVTRVRTDTKKSSEFRNSGGGGRGRSRSRARGKLIGGDWRRVCPLP
jgi:cell division cycle protein 20 (cofactor of APC complex)